MEEKIRELIKNFKGSRMHLPGEPFIQYLISELKLPDEVKESEIEECPICGYKKSTS